MTIEHEFSVWSRPFKLEGVFPERKPAEDYARELAEEFGSVATVVEHEKGQVQRP